MTEKTWQQHLVDLHPKLFIRSFRNVPFCPGYPVAGDGWREIISSLIERVSAAADGYPIHFVQICERHGRLRIYWRAEANLPTHLERAIEEAIARAEARSTCSCVACGAKARLFSDEGRLMPSCQDHARGVPVSVRPGMENLHIVLVGRDDSRVVACRRYDRARDQFVDVDLRSLGIDDWHEILRAGNTAGVTIRLGGYPE
jgi:hypothetical protein